ncbi:DNA replication ATP-dependent helicase/nuclease DNA2 [Astathelohania contejeani]|uniref:DNA replication ATP-dependent helicase/nuclease n=1 Tax=Astathelohania contejeani TaxID=164912 RepID=A0ABQ7I1J2_9MICR|nr:DNA replication ATP-dependent helicase/nuclease DNA2 [Thelohania contejeani]
MKEPPTVSWQYSQQNNHPAKRKKCFSLNDIPQTQNKALQAWYEADTSIQEEPANDDDLLSSVLDIEGEIFSDEQGDVCTFTIEKIEIITDGFLLTGNGVSCIVKGEWSEIEFEPGMKIKAFPIPRECTSFTVDDHSNFLVIEDELMSVTQLCNGFVCSYRAVLKGAISEISFDRTPLCLAVGLLIHFVVESALKSHTFSINFLVHSARDWINKNINLVYAAGADESQMLNEFLTALPGILGLKEVFSQHVDTEVAVMSYRYGLRGIIDAVICEGPMRAPLELKSGRVCRIEHRAQTIAYQLMLSERQTNTNGIGYLYYTGSGALIKVKPTHSEIRSILVKRNILCVLKRGGVIKLNKIFKPEMSYNAQYDNSDDNKDDNIYYKEGGMVKDEISSDFSLSDFHSTEDSNKKENNILKDKTTLEPCNCPPSELCKTLYHIYQMDNKKGLFLQTQWEEIIKEESKIQITFSHFNFIKQESDLLILENKEESDLSEGALVDIYDPNKIKVSYGKIVKIDKEFVYVSLIEYANLISHTEFYLSVPNNLLFFKTMRYSLLNIAIKDSFIMNLIIERWNNNINDDDSINDNINADDTLSIPDCYRKEFYSLNDNQRIALYQALNCNQYKLIHGMPGTGKSSVISLLIRILVYYRKKILLVCYTNMALENIIKRIKGIKLHRAKKDSVDNILTVTELAKYYDSIDVVAGTAYSFGDAVFVNRVFDFCIIDEASQIHLLLALIPISRAKKFVLVGDHLQLTPLAKQSKELRKSLFEYLIGTGQTTKLCLQYRMGASIMNLSNDLFYSGKMVCGSKEKGEVIFIDTNSMGLEKWLGRIEDSCVVLCYFNTMVGWIKKRCKWPVQTVDRFQGSESENVIVIFDPVTDCEIMQSNERLNVALTRARNKLVLVGNKEKMKKVKILKKLLRKINLLY